MKAGSLDREIMIQRCAVTLAASGAPLETWATIATLRAQLVENAASEQSSAAGAFDARALTFKIRWFDGVTIGDRVLYQGHPFELRGVQELGRRRALELQCKGFGQ